MNSRVLLIRRWVARTTVGRITAASAALKLLVFLLRLATGDVAWLEAFDTIADIGLVVGGVTLASIGLRRARRAVLWRVSRKLTLSYVFIGVVPALLIVAFFLTGGLLLFFNVSAFVIRGRIGAFLDHTQSLAQGAAFELQGTMSPGEMAHVVALRQAATATRYPLASYALVPADQTCPEATQDARSDPGAPVVAGPWRHDPAPESMPAWVTCAGQHLLVPYEEPGPDGPTTRLAARGIAWPDARNPHYAVVVDIPLSGDIARQLREQTGVELGAVATLVAPATDGGRPRVNGVAAATRALPDAARSGIRGLWERPFEWVTFLDVTDWTTGQRGSATVSIHTSLGAMYARVFATPPERSGDFSFGQILFALLAVVGGLFLVIQSVAFVMGFGLARSITGSVHELFAGTERVQRGDFTHRIAVRSRDELGDLAASFNLMTASIEDLLLQKEEKERMEQELRIARRIQMSLLPQAPVSVPGLALVAHCEPAREVGGDYYDFVRLADHRLALLVADVAGKGTSAALYMAELKGVILTLSRRHTSPRALLVEADRILARDLDTRSFITMTYAVVDLEARTLTYARAGHCPVIQVPGPYAASRAPRVLTEGGMVLGLKLDDGSMFARLLTDVTLPLVSGDLFLWYTDGLPEAMNEAGDCFGDDRLAALVAEHADLPVEALRERILREIAAFAGAAPQHDDMTLILMRVGDR